jgi:hypothetical protein
LTLYANCSSLKWYRAGSHKPKSCVLRKLTKNDGCLDVAHRLILQTSDAGDEKNEKADISLSYKGENWKDI